MKIVLLRSLFMIFHNLTSTVVRYKKRWCATSVLPIHGYTQGWPS